MGRYESWDQTEHRSDRFLSECLNVCKADKNSLFVDRGSGDESLCSGCNGVKLHYLYQTFNDAGGHKRRYQLLNTNTPHYTILLKYHHKRIREVLVTDVTQLK